MFLLAEPVVLAAVSPAEHNALVDLYNSTNGASWTNKTNWLVTADECTWYGVACDVEHTTVQEIELPSNNLGGTLPSSLGNLTSLQHLSVFSNQLSGSIPTQLGNLTSLLDLELSVNHLTGSIPSELGSLTQLQFLLLSSNQLSGSIPTQLGNLTSLLDLSLGDNQLSGSIPTEFGNLTSLLDLNLGGNQLSGSIPTQLGNLTSLLDLYLGVNQMNASIPPELGNLRSLQNLFLGGNQLSGSIPPQIGNLTSLKWLVLGDSRLSGSIPHELGNLTSLEHLDLGYASLSGDIPPELGSLTSLGYLLLNGNELSGSIPSTLTNLTSLSNLALDFNALYCSDPPVTSFLGDKQPGWFNSQTIAPTNLSISDTTASTTTVNWTPIVFTDWGGFYQVWYSTTAGGPYTPFVTTTSSKTSSSLTVTGLSSNTTYYFVVATTTDEAAQYNFNFVTSGFSAEVSGVTASTGNLTGTVRDSATNDVISGALVSFNGSNTITNASGVYNLPNLACATSTLAVSKNGYTAASVAYSFTGCLGTSTKDVTLVPIVSTGILTGTVRDSATNGVISGALVSFNGSNTMTDPSGLYTLPNLMCATSTLTVSKSGYTTASTAYNFTSCPGTSTKDVRLAPSAGAPPVIINTFSANPSTILAGQSSTLNWTTTNATAVTISGFSGLQPVNASVSVSPTSSTAYTLTATGPFGTATASTTIAVGISIGEHNALVDLFNSTNGASWTNKTNWLVAADDCTWYGVTCDGNHTAVQAVEFGGNNLSGTLPSSLGNLANLSYLNLSINKHLTGNIPSQLGNLTRLQTLELVGNQLSGSIPQQLGSLAMLSALSLEGNQLSGSIPAQLGNLTSLQSLFLGNNQLSGSIPAQLGDLTSLRGLDLNSNLLSGSIPSTLTNLTSLRAVDGNDISDGIDIRWNALYSTDPALTSFLYAHFGPDDWQSSQTIAPMNLRTLGATPNAITVSWSPIAYTADSGFYQVVYSTTSGGPYTPFATTTANKSASSLAITGLASNTRYYFVVSTTTQPGDNNTNTVSSGFSEEVSGLTVAASSPVINSFVASQTTINAGDPVTLSWSTTNADSVTIDNAIGAVALSGSKTIAGLTATTTFTLTASRSGSSLTATATVTVLAPLTAGIVAIPESIHSGEQATLVWSSTGGENVAIDNGIGTVPSSGAMTVSSAQSTKYTMDVMGGSRTISSSTKLTVLTVPPPAISAFSALPESVAAGTAVSLSWAGTGGTSATIDNSVGSVSPAGGSKTVTPLATTIYTLTVTGAGGVATRAVSIQVNDTPALSVSLLAGTGQPGSDDGASAVASFNRPFDLAVIPRTASSKTAASVAHASAISSYDVFVLDSNHTIRRISPDGTTVTWAGQAGVRGNANGFRTAATFDFSNYVGAIAANADGTLEVIDGGGLQRHIDTAGNVTDVCAACARFTLPAGLVRLPDQTTYIADAGNHTVTRISPSGAMTVIGRPGQPGLTDGQPDQAQFNRPRGMTVDAAGTVYVLDTGNNAVRKINSENVVSTMTVSGSAAGGGDLILGCCAGGITLAPGGGIYISDPGSNMLKKVGADGSITTVAGSGTIGSANGSGSSATFNNPLGACGAPDGSLILTDTNNNTVRAVVLSPQEPARKRAVEH